MINPLAVIYTFGNIINFFSRCRPESNTERLIRELTELVEELDEPNPGVN